MDIYESENSNEIKLKKPTTIEELKEWYKLKNLPPENIMCHLQAMIQVLIQAMIHQTHGAHQIHGIHLLQIGTAIGRNICNYWKIGFLE